jgi:RNA polymerase sigma-70 factor, ECF subfamily
MSGRISLRLAVAAGTDLPVGEVSETEVALFQAARPRLLGIAHRVLGNASEAEDVVQETWFRWHRTDRCNVRDVAAFLATTTTRLAINVSQSARARREMHVDTWLLDQVDAATNPSADAEQSEALEAGVRMLMQKLSPAERAAYVLREAFDYPYGHIAQALALSEANARQLVTRARRRLCGDHRRPAGATEHQRLLDAFVAAAQTGDLTALEQLLAADVVACASVDEPVPATRLPVRERPGVPIAA